MKKNLRRLLIALLSVTVIFAMGATAFAADGDPATIDSVRAAIQALSADPSSFTADDREMVEAIYDDYESLSAEDQATIDTETSHQDTGQPLGRVLETALWGVWSYNEIDNSTTLPNGTYDATTTPALSSSYSKGKSTSGRQKPWSVKSVTVADGKATATITVESTSYAGLWMGGVTYPKTNTSGNCEFAGVPIDLNSTFYFAGISSSMPTPIAFSVTSEIAEPINLAITNKLNMFKAVTASLESTAEGQTLVMALSGIGYHNLFKGTYEEAVANDDNTENWIKGSQNADGKWEFRIPVAEGETTIPLVAISETYYQNYLSGQNPLARAFYPRQVTVDAAAATLVTDDYHSSQSLTVTNNISMFKVNSASLDTVGGPNSNGYKADLVLNMGSDSYIKAFPGSYAEANAAETGVADLADGNVFAVQVLGIETFGQPETIWKKYENGTPFYMSFYSKKNQAWYERTATLDDVNGTLLFNPSAADYTAVNAALATIPEDLSVYTDESAAAVETARDAVVTGKFASQQAEVDAMATALRGAIDALITKLDAAQAAIAAAKADLTNKEKVEAALAAIEKLTDEQKEALKDDISIIQDAKTAIDKAEEKALEDAEAAIAAAKVDPTNKEKVEAALAAIEKLTEEQKAKLQADIKAIKDAKATIDKLEKDAKEAAEKAAKDAAEKAALKARELAFNKVTIAAIPAKTYTGKAIKPKLTVKDGSTTLKQGTDYSVAYKNNKNAGKATVTVTAMGDKYSGTKTVNFTINKAKNKLKVKAVKKTFKVKANKKTGIKAKKAFKVTKNVSKGKVTYKKIKGSKKITVSKTGKITVKKGLKKGKTYTVKVKATSKATKNYKSAKVTVTLKIKVKK